ncbi:class I SAM-dependent methyltransferase [Tropicimonas sp. TH_r6]|uniref:class I SAM-dependent methyltransferase n=1 Tax=Tropicimonas sp. TH_r6 TaxID=3082085 RepID=UPI002954A392|nr:class I SAM-dependent methyltransferase [Tropicimonas sp. TH_r6]MDV7143718.1 class I SAM-dependent methyltransferase [Tropicimonas sp. TH_r6]
MSISRNIKSGYVQIAHGLGRGADAVGLIPWLDRRATRSRRAHWLRSLFAIHDVDALVSLDVPWWTYAAIDEVDAFLKARPGARVFEYGSGASTVWLARRAGSVTSVEHMAGWHERVELLIAAHALQADVDLRLVEPDATPSEDSLYLSQKPGETGASFTAYAAAIDAADGPFDVIVVDGRARQACLEHAKRRLAPDGIIVFDNSNRARYRDAIENSGLHGSRLRGLTPSLPYPDETTLLAAGAAST